MLGDLAACRACLDFLFRLPRRVPFASVQKEPKDSPRHPAPAASRLGYPRCIVAPGGPPPRSFVDRGGSRGVLPLVPLRNDSARPPDGAGSPPHHLASKQVFVPARSPQAGAWFRRANNRLRLSAAYPGYRRIPPMALFALHAPETPDNSPEHFPSLFRTPRNWIKTQ